MALGYTSYATKMIITKGFLGHQPGEMTLPKFNLIVEKAPPRDNKAYGGGPYPGSAWNVIKDADKFYQPVDKKMQDVPFYQVPVDQEKKYVEGKNVNVIMRARIGNKEYKKIYSIKEQYAPMAITISKFANKSYENITIVAENIRRIGKKAKIIIENFRPKK